MKKIITVVLAMAFSFSASFVLAGGHDSGGNQTNIGIGIKNDIDVNASAKANAEANAKANANAWQKQESTNINKNNAEGGKVINSGNSSSSSSSSVNNSGNSKIENSGNATLNFKDESIGSLPQASTHGIGAASFPLNDYGHFITQMNMNLPVITCDPWTKSNFDTMVEVMEKTDGGQPWRKINDKIQPNPIIKKRYAPLRNSEAVYFLNRESVIRVLSGITDENIVGLEIYNSKFDKKRPVVPPHFKPRAYIDAAELGANIAIPMDQFFQGYFVPEGFEFSLGGLLSWMSRSLFGGSAAANAGISKQQNTEFGRPGGAFLFLRVDNPAKLCVAPPKSPTGPVPPPVPQVVEPKKPEPPVKKCSEAEIWGKIIEKEKEVKACKPPCYNNELKRGELGTLYEKLYICTGDKRYLKRDQFGNDRDEVGAIGQFEIAERDYRNGIDIKQNQNKADRVLRQVYYNWAAAIRELYGREEEIKHAQKYGLRLMPENINEIKEIKE